MLKRTIILISTIMATPLGFMATTVVAHAGENWSV